MTLLFSSIGIGIELIVLSIISRRLTSQIYLVLFRMTKSNAIGVSLLTAALFPGTILHELSHLFTAEVLGVHTGKLSLVPEFEEKSEGIHAGSVAIQKTDPFRRTLIGLAPLCTGLASLIAIAYTITIQWQSWVDHITEGSYGSILVIFGIIYLTFAISNTMFSSPEDLKGVFPLLFVLGLFSIGCYAVGFRIVFPSIVIETTTKMSIILCQTLGGVIGINLIFLLLSSWINSGIKKI